MRIARAVPVVFAVTMIALGILGLTKSDYAVVWQPLPQHIPALNSLWPLVLVWQPLPGHIPTPNSLCAYVSIACGIGLLWRPTAAAAARVLLAYLLLWLLLVRLPGMLLVHTVEYWWAASRTAVIAAAAWVVYISFAADWDRRWLGLASGVWGLRMARGLYGLALIPFGLAHFLYLELTAPLVPRWLPWHVGWAYFTGGAFIAAGVAVLMGVYARLAAALSAFQIGMFTLLVWVPIVAARSTTTFQQSETIVSAALTVGAWVVANSYRGVPWLAANVIWLKDDCPTSP